MTDLFVLDRDKLHKSKPTKDKFVEDFGVANSENWPEPFRTAARSFAPLKPEPKKEEPKAETKKATSSKSSK